MREIVVNLYQNLGTGALGTQMSLSEHLIKLGDISQSIDEDLTKISHGDLTIEVEDFDGSVWAFIQSGLSSDLGFLPPFLTLDVGGVRAFTGIVNPSELRRNRGPRTLEINAQDWSVMLMSQGLDGDRWLRPKPTVPLDRPEETQLCFSAIRENFAGGDSMPGPNDGYTALSSTFMQPGDMVTFAAPATWTPPPGVPLPTGQLYRVASATQVNSPFTTGWGYPEGPVLKFELENFNWPGVTKEDPDPYPAHPAFECNITRVVSGTAPVNQYWVAVGIVPDSNKPTYTLTLNTVDALAVGDTIALIRPGASGSWTVLSIDAELKQVTTKEEIGIELLVNDPIDLSEDSKNDLVYEDARVILARCCLPYACDLTRFKPPVLPDPVLAWVPLRPREGGDIRAVADVECGLTDLRVIGSDSQAWDGTPDDGWVFNASPGSKRVIWTDQTVVRPSSLMSEETATVFPTIRRRNRAYHSFDWREVDNGDDVWTPEDIEAPGCIVHDYVGMRRVTITGTSLSIQTWNGSSYDAETTSTWPTANKPQSAVPMPGISGAILAVTSGKTLELAFSSSTLSLALTDAQALGVLVTTPWGAYLVGAQGYGRVDTDGSALTLHWVDLSAYISAWWPNTFCGLTQDDCFILGRFDTQDDDGKAISETWAFRLDPTPLGGTSPASEAVLWAEKITEGVPRLVGAFRDPTKLNRVVGHCGGRIFQVDCQLPYTLERFKAVGMEAGELIEHICQLMCSVAVPMATATLQIVSRQWTSTPSVINPDVVSTEETRAWEHYYSTIRVSDVNDENYFDAGDLEGGKLLEFTRHPMVWTYSSCAGMAKSNALWFGVPRQVRVQKWFYTDPATAAPWEALEGFATVQLLGETSLWVLVSLQHSVTRGTASATMVELSRPGYGMSYGKGKD